MISFITLLSYDYKYAFGAIKSYYEIADEIVLCSDIDKISWSRHKFDMDLDEIFDFISEIDVENKIKMFRDNFHKNIPPMDNETLERNYARNLCSPDNWVIHIDADERITNQVGFKEFVLNADKNKSISSVWEGVFKSLPEGDLVINANEVTVHGSYAPFPYSIARTPNGELSTQMSPFKLRHYSWGRTEDELWQKLTNWGHSNDFDLKKFFDFWKSLNASNYKDFHNFHPLDRVSWPSLSLVKK